MKTNQDEFELSGLIVRFPLVEVLQFLAMSQKTGSLVIHRNGKAGIWELFFAEGQLVHARTSEFAGMAAFEQIMGLEQGRFKFVSIKRAPEQSIDGDINFLLLETQRRADELRNLNANLPDDDAVPFIVRNVTAIPELNVCEWRVLSMINGRRTIRRVCEKYGDELKAKESLASLMTKGLVTVGDEESEWQNMVPIPVSSDEVSEERPYPPLPRTNLLLKSIDGYRTLEQLQTELKCSSSDLLEDIRVLHKTLWLKFSDFQEKKYARIKEDF